MRRFVTILFVIAFASDVFAQDSMIDDRDGKVYSTIKIGTQVWMAENLKFNKGLIKLTYPSTEINGKEESECYFSPLDKPELCDKYGVLYSWKSAQEACPTGWYLPSREDFQTMLSVLPRRHAYDSLVSTGFKMQLPGAVFNYSSAPEFEGNETYGVYWTSSNNESNSRPVYVYFGSKMKMIGIHKAIKESGFSVRRIKR